MRILGIDYGKKRIGLALSDPLGITAQGLPTLFRKGLEEDLEELARIIREKEVSEIVVGLPKRMDDTLGKSAQEVLGFVEKLKARLSLPIHLVDERLSTVRAHRAMKEVGGLTRKERTGKVDKIAAQLILQDYLDRRRPHEGEDNNQTG